MRRLPAPTTPTHTPIGVNTIQEGSFLTLHYRLAGPDGADVINTFDDKPATLSLGSGQLAPAMEQRLLGLPEGCRETFALAAGEAFGERNPAMLQRVKRALLHELGDPDATYAVGDVVQFPTPDGHGQPTRAPCNRSARTATVTARPTPCCLTSTTRWRASP